MAEIETVGDVVRELRKRLRESERQQVRSKWETTSIRNAGKQQGINLALRIIGKIDI